MSRALCVGVSIGLAVGLAGCLDMLPGKSGHPQTQTPMASKADSARVGKWLGGLDPVSGKLRSGISTYYQVTPDVPVAGQPFVVTIRLEGVEKDDAQMELLARDLRLVNASEPRAWKLKNGQVSQVQVQLLAVAGDNYLHVATMQNKVNSVRSLVFSTADAPAPRTSSVGTAFETAADGSPIVKMQALPPKVAVEK